MSAEDLPPRKYRRYLEPDVDDDDVPNRTLRRRNQNRSSQNSDDENIPVPSNEDRVQRLEADTCHFTEVTPLQDLEGDDDTVNNEEESHCQSEDTCSFRVPFTEIASSPDLGGSNGSEDGEVDNSIEGDDEGSPEDGLDSNVGECLEHEVEHGLTVTSTQLKKLGPVHIAFLKQQALRKQQQMKLERVKLQQQAQAQAQAVQVQAQAQAQAAHQQVQLQTLTKLAVPSGSTATTTITQQQLTALHQQQLAQKLRSPEVQAIPKQRAKGLSTVKGLTVSSVPGVASQVLSQAQAQIKQQAVTVSTQPGTTLKTLTLPQGTTVGPAGSSGTPQKVNFLQLVQMPKQTHKVGTTGQPQQLSLSRVQQVGTPGQGVTQNATLVQRVVAGQVRVQTVRQQLQQSQVKRNQGTTLSIQQAGKPVTIIPHGSSVRAATPKVSTSVTSQQYTQLMANSKQVLTQLVQQAGGQTSTPQLARIISQPAVTSLQAKQVGQSMAQAILIQEDPPMVSISNAPNTITAATSKQAVAAATSLQSIVAARQAGAQQGTSGVKQAALSISNVLAAATRKPTAATNVQATAPGKQSVVTVQQATGTSKPSTAIMQAVAGMARPSVTQQLALGAHRMVQHSNITSRSVTAGSGQAAIVISQASLSNKQGSAAGNKQASAASSIQSSVANTVQTATLKQQGPVQAVTQPAATTVSQQTISATPQPTTSSAQQAVVVEQSPTGSSTTGVATPAMTTPATTTPQVTTGKETVIEEVGGSEEGDGEQGDSKDPDAVRASPYAMRLRKPSQSGN